LLYETGTGWKEDQFEGSAECKFTEVWDVLAWVDGTADENDPGGAPGCSPEEGDIDQFKGAVGYAEAEDDVVA
jgi:hypothetical protein